MEKKGLQAFKEFVSLQYQDRRARNPRYSMRAFAKSLDIDPSSLLQFLNTKRRLPVDRQVAMAICLKANPADMTRWFGVEMIPKFARYAEGFAVKFGRSVTPDVLKYASEWWHGVIFEIVTLKDTQNDPAWIAEKLGITVPQVEDALERLKRLGLIEAAPGKKWRQITRRIITQKTAETAKASIDFHLGTFQNALRSLQGDPRDESVFCAATFAIDKKRLAEAEQMIRRFRTEMSEFLQDNDDERNSVYQMSVALFPVVKP